MPVLLPVAVYLAGVVGQALSGAGGDGPFVLAVIGSLLAVPVALGALLGRRAPDSPVGPALAWVGAAPAAAFWMQEWGRFGGGAWVWNLAGFVALCLVFPSGLPTGRRWRLVPAGCVAAGVYVHALLSSELMNGRYWLPLALTGYAVVLAALVAAVTALIVHYRRGDDTTRQRVRWLMLGALSVPILQAAGWVAQGLGAPPGFAYLGLFAALLIALPAAIVVAVLRHDLLDIDRLIGSTLAWVLTTLGSAGVFALAVTLIGEAVPDRRLGTAAAAFGTALVLLPMHRRLNTLVGRFVDRDRYVGEARVQRFVQQVRDGAAEPERAEDVFRSVLGDPGLRLRLRLPGRDAFVRLDGTPDPVGGEPGRVVPLRSGGTDVGELVLSAGSPRRLRRARELALAARLPIEVSRLRLELREALRDVRDSRARLLQAGAAERRRLERDLHDGAQQRIVSVGMRLRSTQRGLAADSPAYRDLDLAVEALEATIAELRQLAHGLRPSRLDDGLPAAVRALVADAPLDVRVRVADVRTTEAVGTTVYFAVAEAWANALKHAGAGCVDVTVAPADDGALLAAVADDGVGGAGDLTAVRDRVASLGGTLRVDSPPGGGTRIEVRIPGAVLPEEN
ncbi:histidine kinase [Dactylosporangium sp. NPDC049140]|uniref:sensor histidine kinase n=1 Tax=Dactylosporangium sp. NPDC049140 TaxID=3155647 RepID=UPI0033C4712D